MSSFLQKAKGFMLGYDEYDDYGNYAEHDEDEYNTQDEVYEEERVSKRPSSKSKIIPQEGSNIIELPNNQKNFVVISAPKNTDEAVVIIDSIKDNKTCIVNLEGVPQEAAQRIADFLSGALYSLNGEIKRVSNDIFITAPDGVDISGKIAETLNTSTGILPWLAK